MVPFKLKFRETQYKQKYPDKQKYPKLKEGKNMKSCISFFFLNFCVL